MLGKSERQRDFSNICSRCRDVCCRNARPPTTLKRKTLMEAYVKRRKILVENPFVQTAYTFPREDDEGYCTFYDKQTKKCRVHPVKPETCVAGPITFDINKSKRKIEWHLKMEEICPLAGWLLENEETLREHLKSAKKELLMLVHELDSEALKAILKIEEPKTFQIAEDDIGKEIVDKL